MSIILVGVCWLVSLWGVIHDLRARLAPTREILLWVPLTLVLGPLAVPCYLLEVGLSRPRAFGHARVAPPAALDQSSTLAIALRQQLPRQRRRSNTLPALASTLMPGSGVYLYIRVGCDAHHSVEIPANGSVVVRRGASNERSVPGTLVLHDPAVSRKQHCRVTLGGGQCTVEDSSTYGSLVDGQHIHHASATLKIGSLICVGSTTLVLLSHRQIKITNKA